MKLIYAIVSDEDSHIVAKHLAKNHFFCTKLSSSGGFLMSGNTTFMICTEDDKVSEAIEVIRTSSKKRKQMTPTAASYDVGLFPPMPIEVTVGGATVFVISVDHFEKI